MNFYTINVSRRVWTTLQQLLMQQCLVRHNITIFVQNLLFCKQEYFFSCFLFFMPCLCEISVIVGSVHHNNICELLARLVVYKQTIYEVVITIALSLLIMTYNTMRLIIDNHSQLDDTKIFSVFISTNYYIWNERQ